MRNRYNLLQFNLFFTVLSKGKVSFRKLWNVFICSLKSLWQSNRSANFPFILSLELGNECNTSCLFCRDAEGKIYDINAKGDGVITKGKMPLDMALDAIEQVKDDILIAVLYTNGEPLLYHDLPKVIKYASGRKVATMISSNGLALNDRIGKEILEAGLDLIKIQLGGFTQDVYGVQIRYGSVEKLKNNIRSFAELRNKGRYRTVILVDYISYNYNRHQMPLVREFCNEIGVMFNTRPGNPKNGLEGKEPALTTEELPLKISCDWLWKGMQVNWNGDILPCCEAVVWSNPIVYEKYQVGKTNLKEVWNSRSATIMRDTMATKGRGSMPMCEKCLRTGICFKW